MLNWYSVALFAHIVGVLVLFIAMALQWLATLQVRRATSTTQAREWSGLGVGVNRVAPISGALILGAGVYLAMTRWSLLAPWILVSLAAMLLMMALGMGIVGRRLRAVQRAALGADAIPAALRARIDDPALWVAMQMALAAAMSIVFLMTTKPNLALSMVVVVVALALGGVAGGLSAKPLRASQPKAHTTSVESASRV